MKKIRKVGKKSIQNYATLKILWTIFMLSIFKTINSIKIKKKWSASFQFLQDLKHIFSWTWGRSFKHWIKNLKSVFPDYWWYINIKPFLYNDKSRRIYSNFFQDHQTIKNNIYYLDFWIHYIFYSSNWKINLSILRCTEQFVSQVFSHL